MSNELKPQTDDELFHTVRGIFLRYGVDACEDFGESLDAATNEAVAHIKQHVEQQARLEGLREALKIITAVQERVDEMIQDQGSEGE